MATIYDVAREAGVAPSTVSYVLNNTKNVKESTRRKVMDAVEKLNYTPSSIARSLKTKTTSTIGIVLPDISNPFFSEITKGIEDVANEYGYTVFICNTYENIQKEEKYLNTFLSKDIDGLILVSTSTQNFNDMNLKIPIVAVDRKVAIDSDKCGYISVDNEKGGYDAVYYLMKKTPGKVLVLSGPTYINTYAERLLGCKKAFENNGRSFSDDIVFEVLKDHISIDGGFKMMKGMVEKGIIQPGDGVFATNDLIAIGAIKALQKMGYRVPKDIKIIGFDDIYPSSLITPALTTIAQPKYEMGAEAMKMLYGFIYNEKNMEKTLRLVPELIERESV